MLLRSQSNVKAKEHDQIFKRAKSGKKSSKFF